MTNEKIELLSTEDFEYIKTLPEKREKVNNVFAEIIGILEKKISEAFNNDKKTWNNNTQFQYRIEKSKDRHEDEDMYEYQYFTNYLAIEIDLDSSSPKFIYFSHEFVYDDNEYMDDKDDYIDIDRLSLSQKEMILDELIPFIEDAKKFFQAKLKSKKEYIENKLSKFQSILDKLSDKKDEPEIKAE